MLTGRHSLSWLRGAWKSYYGDNQLNYKMEQSYIMTKTDTVISGLLFSGIHAGTQLCACCAEMKLLS